METTEPESPALDVSSDATEHPITESNDQPIVSFKRGPSIFHVPLTDPKEGEVPNATPSLESRLHSIEEHNRTIQNQLEKTQQMIQTLTTMVQGLQQQQTTAQPSTADAHSPLSRLQLAVKTLPTITSPTSSPPSSPTAATQLHRQKSNEDLDSMTRTIKMIPPLDILAPLPTRTGLSLAGAVKVMRQVARAASAKTLRPPEGLIPMMTRRFSVSSLDFSSKKEGTVRRIARWSRNLFMKPRVDPGVTKRDVQAARAEDSAVHPYTIRHESSWRISWDMVVMILIFIDIVLTPLNLSFGFDPPGLKAFNALETVVFALDFAVQAMSSYTSERGVVVSGPQLTISHYLMSGWALVDFLSWFPLEVVLPSDQGRFLGIAKVIRLVKISHLARRFNSSKKAGMFRLIRLISIVFLVSHCLTCYWNWVAHVWRENEEGYLLKPMAEKYSHCWSLVIGSLNASPPQMFTPIEEISVSVFMLIGNVLQASVFGSVAVLISSFDEEEVAYNRKLLSTYERCKLLGIPDLLAVRIRNYYEHLYRETRSVDPDADAFINELSPALVCEVKFHLYRDMVKQIPFFSSTAISPVVIEMLILKLRSVIYMQDDVLIRKGEFGDWMGFIGTKGSVGILDPNSDMRKIVRILRRGEYFGEMGLLHRTKRTTTAVALSWVQIHVLSRSDLDEVKEQYAEEAESLENEIGLYTKSRR